jgi:hypothetical protein
MKTKKALFYLLLCIIGGCGPTLSLHQLYYEKDVVLDQRLFGRWDNEPNKITMEFTSPEKEGKTYRLIYTSIDNDSKKLGKGLFTVHLVKLKDKLFLDIFPEGFPCGKFDDPNDEMKWFYNTFFIMPVHTFAVVDSIEPQLKLRLTDDDKMKELLEKDPNAIKHEMVNDRLVLTDDTAELQKFVLKYADNEDVFSNELILKKSEIRKSNIKIVEPPSAGKKN